MNSSHMTFETYDPTKHTLEVGRTIRLAGREGEIVLTDSEGGELGYQVEWGKLTHSYLDLSAYPLLEIAVSPITIDKRVREEIRKLLVYESVGNGPMMHREGRRVMDYLNSLEEV